MGDTKPTGKLSAGGVGGILLCASFALTLVAAFSGGGGGMGVMGGGILGLIGVLLLVGGGICHALGFFGLGAIHGGTNKVGGIFTLILGIMPVVLFIVGIIAVGSAGSGGMSRGGAEATGGILGVLAIVMALSLALSGILGGIGLMASSVGLAKPAGILLIVGGSLVVLQFLNGLVLGVGIIGTITSYGVPAALGVAYLLSGLTMFAERNT